VFDLVFFRDFDSNCQTNSLEKSPLLAHASPLIPSPTLSNQITSVPFKPGDTVAVKLPTNSFWITAVVIRWVQEKGKLEVMDAEDDEENPGTRK
jgi:hypothetical protein